MTPQELKNSILQLAIQGRLVEQRPEEGTGEELYQRIQDEKQALIKAGKIKKDRRTAALETPSLDIIPFDIPETWKWVYLGSILNKLTDGTHRTPKYSTSGVKFVSVKDMSTGVLFLDNTKFITASEHEELFSRCDPERGDMLLSKVGTTGVPAIVNTDEPFSLFVSVALLKYNHCCIDEAFFYYLLKSPLVQLQATENTRGVGNKNWVLDAIAATVVVLPPLAEQKRIVAKIEELLPLIDRYEKAWSRLEDFNKRFPGDMQKSILQLAIQGRLVEQRPEEGTGEDLYQQIQAEKQALIKAGKIKKEKPLPEITEDEVPFEIPESWKWVRLATVTSLLSGFAFKSEDFKKDGKYKLLRGINLGVNDVRWKETVFIDAVVERLDAYRLEQGDVLLGLDRPWISDGTRVAIFNEDEVTYLVQRVLRIRGNGYITSQFIALLLRSSLLKNPLGGETTGISVPHISPNQVGSIVIPLPPFAEQKRIVAKLEELLPLCERLK